MMQKYHAGNTVPYSRGTNTPKSDVPVKACDSHLHIYDPSRFTYRPDDLMDHPPATVNDYRMLMERLQLERCVIVTPSAYGTDNRCTLDALKQLGHGARAVVVLDEEKVTDEQLADMDLAGVRGVRYFIKKGKRPDTGSIDRMARRIAALGWHLDFWMCADLTAGMEGFLNDLPCRIVFDHRGHLPCQQGIRHPAFSVISNLMEKGKAWVKLQCHRMVFLPNIHRIKIEEQFENI
jgi:predicted TIM-barrel fold metal-dependent hydrolase